MRADGRTDAYTETSNAAMNRFLTSQAASLKEKDLDPTTGVIGRLAAAPRVAGLAMRALGSLEGGLSASASVNATPPNRAVQTPSGHPAAPSTPNGTGLKRVDSFGRRAGALFGFGSGRGSKDTNRATASPPLPAMQSTGPPVPIAPSTGAMKRSDSFLSRAKRRLAGGSVPRGLPDSPKGADGGLRQHL